MPVLSHRFSNRFLNRNSAFILIGILLCQTAAATSTWFARQSSVANMTDEDLVLLDSAMNDLLNNQPDNSSSEWINPGTGSSGRLAVGKTHQDYGTTCRLLKMENTVKGVVRAGNYRLCLDNGKAWRFAPISRSGY